MPKIRCVPAEHLVFNLWRQQRVTALFNEGLRHNETLKGLDLPARGAVPALAWAASSMAR